MEFIHSPNKNNENLEYKHENLQTSCSLDNPCIIDLCWLNGCVIDLI